MIPTLARRFFLAWLALAGSAQAQQRIPPDATYPGGGGDNGAVVATPNSALNCMMLVPTPDLLAATGAIALLPVHTPFGVAATTDGRPRYHLYATVAGLPDPSSLGDYTGYVAWAYTLAFDAAVKLGPVTNGRVELGELAYVQFRILISAERSDTVSERRGRLVLRGTSPSARLLAHRDFLQPSAPGVLRDSASGAPDGSSATHSTPGGMTHGASQSWSMPPMPPWMPMTPVMQGLTPSVAPFLPGAGPDPATTLRDARPRAVVQLASGDTLALEAGLVRRTIAGKTFVMYGFNGQYPGPLIEVGQGATITVRYHNALDQPSTVHWHGIRLDNRFDGTPGVTQAPVPPGGSFTYTIHFPDAGIYWYHPHVREDIQQDLGLYGNLVVRSPEAGYYSTVNREEVLMVDDILLDEHGPVPYGAGAPTHALMGRFGNVFLVNGEPDYALEVKRGEVVRFFLTNVSNTRLYNLSFGDARMKIVGSDIGKFEHEEWVQSVVIAPAERYIVEVEFARSGTVALVNRVQAFNHMFGTYRQEVDTLGLVRVAREPAAARYTVQFETLRDNADVSAEIAPFREYFDKPVDHSLVLTLRTHDLPAAIANMLIGINAPVEWNDGMPMMNWVATGKEVTWVLRDPATGMENMDIDWDFREGEVVKLRLFNDPSSSHAMDHPIHLHGQRFLVLSRDGVANQNLVWKDTAIIPAGETVDLLVDMSNPGRWMLHCHIAEHLGADMMAVFTVAP
ncbi:MAG: multicopper oxidase family protein [Gemmatimonadaceae bacterium]